MEETLNLSELFKFLKKRIPLMLGIIALCVSISGYVSYTYLTPIYEASTQILISKQKEERNTFDSQDIQLNLQLINTYNVVITSRAILSRVIEKLELNMTPSDLQSSMRVSNQQNSQVVNIYVQDPNLQQAVNIANTTVEVFQEDIKRLMAVDNVQILSPAIFEENTKPIKPDPIFNMAVAGIVGVMLGAGISFLLEYFDTTVKSEKEMNDLFDVNVLGIISVISDKEVKKNNKKVKPISRRSRGGGYV
ncbi:Wzz/FepE/Etk N-terminal domain-containing protein [Sporosarcina oncorhynchi]|uniref:Wzz/FepE/Etk N-terminal domain-containing protein n=1 Tax=Sporosarcina oncorhynchi TaxID=3056444 RepID=A0ABZ0L1U0_9BACL|nr:Wzz/FepE/Etk N-terminal domain-containing protein [Sporosarcina sp. T2O-4]WOV86476.1 Wzz/FepE/Etk N-terminal domain-containing protein [Sporosarcina sp. T2O-4]